jgi:hypothetical protein
MTLRPRVLPRLLLPLFLLPVLIAGCGVVPSLGETASGPLLTVTSHGGRCVEGACLSVIVIEQDGRAHLREPAVAELGRVPAVLLQSLATLIRSTDFDTIRARPFLGTCPTAYDGQELIYEFGTPSGLVPIASCEFEVDPSHPLFAAAEAALGTVRP